MVYGSKLSFTETQKAIRFIDRTLDDIMTEKMNMIPVTPPLFVDTLSGLNEGISGFGRTITFDLKSGMLASISSAITKWKRHAMKSYDFQVGTGLFSNAKAVRKEETLDAIHSYYVDQYEWELVIKEEDGTIEFLKAVVRKVYECLRETEDKIVQRYPVLSRKLPEEIVFVSAQDTEDEYPALTPKERELKFAEKHGAVFITQIGKRMKSGEIHSGRAADSDDWELNGDIILHYAPLNMAMELSSMGIRVTKDSLLTQLTEAGELKMLSFPFHQAVVNGEVPFTIGGGIGRSRLIMYLLDKVHIGEVQVSVWDEQTVQECSERNIKLL